MQLNGFETQEEEKPKSKATKILLISMILVFILMIGIILTIMYLQQKIFTVYVNGVAVNLPEETIIFEDSGKIYISIKDIAKTLGYDVHNGEYKLFTEDSNKCYVQSAKETASFYLNSNKISKMPPIQTKDYEDYTIQEPVISKNEKLYCSPEGLQIGFNATWKYDEASNTVEIFTLPYLVTFYTPIMEQYGYQGVSDDFENQKAILYNMFVVTKENGMYGLVNKDNKEIISPKYKKMTFNENAREFYVQDSTNKVGIVTEAGITKINLIYDAIEKIDKKSGLYVVKSSNKYGVLSNSGDIVIHLEYDQIGVDISNFPTNNISNKYLLYENMIPVCQNKKWGAFNKLGKLIIPLELDEIGYKASSSTTGKVVNSLLIVPSYKAVVFGKKFDKDVRYGIYDYEGVQIIPFGLQSAYSITSAGVNTYYMDYNGTTLNIENYIEKQYEKQGKTKPTDTTNTVSNS